jgi:hypothetical protein
MAEHDNAFDARLRNALDITTSDLTPDPSIQADLRSRMRSRSSISRLIGRNGFLPAPVGSFGAIAAAAVLTLFVWSGTQQMPANGNVSGTYIAAIDSSDSIDSLAFAADSLLYHVAADTLSQ